MNTKKWYESSTIWINLVGIIVTVLELIVSTNLIPDPEVVALVVAVLNILNRFRLTSPRDIKPLERSVV